MIDRNTLTRRSFIAGSLGMIIALPLVGCDQVSRTTAVNEASDFSESDSPDASSASSSISSDDASLNYVKEIDKNSIMTFDIEADPDTWQTMLDNAINKEYIAVDITINGLKIEQVGIKPKGNSSLSSIARDDTSDRYSFKIKFNEYVEGQTWLGLDKIVLNSNWSDATSMKEYLSYDILNSIGVDTPLFAYASITLNGEAWGFYLAVEVIDKGFRKRLKNGEGELYKPDSSDIVGGISQNGDDQGGGGFAPGPSSEGPPDFFDGNMPGGEMPDGFEERIQPPEGWDGEMPDFSSDQMPQGLDAGEGQEMPQGGMGGGMGADDAVALKYIDDNESSYSSIFDNAETNSDSEDHQRVILALKMLNEGTDLERYVDVEGCLRYFAGHTSVVSLDSYEGTMGHNYYLYENEGKISILPWDYNMSFGGFQSGTSSDVVNFPLDTPVSGVTMKDRPLIAKLFEVPEYLDQYHAYLQDLADSYFSDGKFEQKVIDLNARIAEYIESDPSAFYSYSAYQDALEELKKLGTLRGESIQGQLDGSIPATREAQQADLGLLIDVSSVDMEKLGDEAGKPRDNRDDITNDGTSDADKLSTTRFG